MKWKKGLLYFAIEILYTCVMLWYLTYIETNFSVPTPFETPLFTIVQMGLIVLIWFIGPMLNRLFVFLYSGIFALYLIAQKIYGRAFHSYFHFATMFDLAGEVAGVKESAAEFITKPDMMPLVLLLGITIVFTILYFTLQRRCVKLLYRIPLKLAVLALFFPARTQYENYLAMIEETKNSDATAGFLVNETDYYIYSVMPNANQFVEKFGVLPYAYRDAEMYLENDVLSEEQRADIASYLASIPEHQPNEMTGIFEGKNVIFIQAESYIDVACSKELTPNIYNMRENGIRIENFNTPALPGSTSDTEFMANTSIIPNSMGHAVCYTYPYNTFVTTLPGLFNAEGYQTYAFHNNYKTYYNREVTMKTFGYQDFLDCTELGLTDAQEDSEVMEIMKWIFTDEEKPYMAYWITYSGHQPYSLDSVGVNEEDVKKIKAKYPELDDSYVSYLAKNMDLDRSLGSLTTALRNAGKLNDVVFVFFGDHIVKGLDFTPSGTFYEQTGIEYADSEKYTDLYFYCADQEAMTYQKVGTALDMIPTVANLWNMSYDPHTVLGNDLFDPNYKGFFFSEWEFWKTDNYAYDFMYGDFYDYGDYDLEQARIEMSNAMHEKDIAGNILKLDYFNTDSKTPQN